MIGRPGSTLWLLGHEVRMARRRIRGRVRKGRSERVALAITLGVPVFFALVVGVPLGLLLRRVELTPGPVAAAAVAFGLLAVFTLMLSQTLSAAVDALYERNDLDLLFSSPLRPRTVMTVRFLGVAFSVFWVFFYFGGGPLLAIAVLGHPEWLSALVIFFALALAASGTGLLLTAALFRVLGPRRTRTLGQVMAALIGAALFLVSQTRQILGESGSRSAWGRCWRPPAIRPSARRASTGRCGR